MKGIKKIDENLISPYRSLTITNPNLPDNANWQVGTLKCYPSVGGLRYKRDEAGNYELFDATQILYPETITSELIKNGTIRTEDLADGCVTNDKIADRTINHIKMQFQTLTEDEMANDSIVTRTIKNENVTADKLATDSVITVKIKDSAVTSEKIANSAVTSMKIADSAVTNTKLSNDSVTNDKIMDGTITGQKIAPLTITGGNIAAQTITNMNIAIGTITSTNLMNGAVIEDKIADGAVTSTKIGVGQVLSSNIANKTIGSEQIADGGIKTSNYANQSITKEKLANDVFDVVNNAVIYNGEGNVPIMKEGFASCAVSIGTADDKGNSMANGSLRVYGDIRADRVYNMAYSDLAEGYIPGEALEPGDIVELREDGKVYKAVYGEQPAAVVGVVSDEFAACYGATKEEIEAGDKVAVALIGRVHVKVRDKVKIGQQIKVGRHPGVGTFWTFSGPTIGVALETCEEDGIQKVLCLVKPC